jgi:hypothetical protein
LVLPGLSRQGAPGEGPSHSEVAIPASRRYC